MKITSFDNRLYISELSSNDTYSTPLFILQRVSTTAAHYLYLLQTRLVTPFKSGYNQKYKHPFLLLGDYK